MTWKEFISAPKFSSRKTVENCNVFSVNFITKTNLSIGACTYHYPTGSKTHFRINHIIYSNKKDFKRDLSIILTPKANEFVTDYNDHRDRMYDKYHNIKYRYIK